MAEKVVIGNAELWHGDCREVALMVRNMQPVRVKANRPNRHPQQVRRLRQDPRTGVYYPEA